MKYICVKSCVINSIPVMSGAVVEVESEEAKMLLGIGRIAPYHEDEIEDRSIGLENSSEMLLKRRGRPKKI